MNKRTLLIWHLRFCISILLLIVPGILPLAAANLQVTIVQSNDNSYYNQTRISLEQQLNSDFQVLVVNTDSIASQKSTLNTSDIIITLGIDAALEISGKFTNSKIISAYITLKQQQQYQAQLKDHSIVLLNQPLSRYLEFAGFMLHPRSIGIINQDKIILTKRQKQTLLQLKLKLQQYEFRPDTSLLTIVRNLLKQNDVHLMLPDEHIYNRDTLKGILLTSYRNRKPVISYSPSHVKAGALASIYSSPSDIGLHIASTIMRSTDQTGQAKPTIEYAQHFSISVNKRVAHALEINLPDEAEFSSSLNKVQK